MNTEDMEALYAELPSIECQGKCAACCGPIAMSRGERERIIDLGVTIPLFTVEAAQRWARDEKIDTCPALQPHPLIKNFGICGVYEARPMICRLWGLTEGMPCPWGCKPSRVLTDVEGFEFLRRAMIIGGTEPGHPGAEEHDSVIKALGHPVCGPLFRRFIGGDRSIEDELDAALREAGLITNP